MTDAKTGVANVALRGSLEPVKRSYLLRLGLRRITLVRREDDDERELGEANVGLNGCEWYDVTIWLRGGEIDVRLDAKPILLVHDEEPLLGDRLEFGAENADVIEFDTIRLVASVAEHFAGPTSSGAGEIPPSPVPTPEPPPAEFDLDGFAGLTDFRTLDELWLSDVPFVYVPTEVIPLERKVFALGKQRLPIDVGIIPPNFVHSWAIDVKDVAEFKLWVSSQNDIQLDWLSGDKITIIDSANTKKAEFNGDLDIRNKTIKVQQTVHDTGLYTRFYVILETSPEEVPRKFRLDGIQLLLGDLDSGEALLVADDINYQTLGPFVDAVDASGPRKIYPPWSPGGPNTFKKPWPKPDPSEGWYLIGKDTIDPEGTTGFFSLVYYNERTSRLRVYLFNVSLSTDVTAYEVTLSLRGRSNEGYVDLRGAFFDLDLRPARWSEARIVVPLWPQNTWTFLEVPMLYPMAEELPARQEGPSKCGYHSIYEDRLERNLWNIRLRVQIQGFIKGPVKGDILGEAVGTAIQKKGAVDFMKTAKALFNAGKQGKAWYDGAKDFFKWAGLSAGLGYFSAGMAAVGAAIALYEGLFGDDELQLAVELALRAELKGSVFLPLDQTTRWHDFYLPGRFSISDAFREGLPMDDANRIAGALARYDRTMGHLGYCFDPSTVEIRMLRMDSIQGPKEMRLASFSSPPHTFPEAVPMFPADVHWLSFFVFPAKANPDYSDEYFEIVVPGRSCLRDRNLNEFVDEKTGQLISLPDEKAQPQSTPTSPTQLVNTPEAMLNLNATPKLDHMLPVIFNPYAEIAPAPPTVVKERAVLTYGNQDVSSALIPDIPSEEVKSTVIFIADKPLWKYEEWYKDLHDMSWATHVTPEPDDLTFPKKDSLWEKTTQGPQSYLQIFNANGGLSLVKGGYAGRRARAQMKFGLGTEETYPRIGPLPHGIRINIKPLSQYVPSTYLSFNDLPAYTEETLWAIFDKQEFDAKTHRKWYPHISRGLPVVRKLDESVFKATGGWVVPGVYPYSFDRPWETLMPFDPDHKMDDNLSVRARKYPYDREYEGSGYRPFDEKDPFPIGDVIFNRDVVYFYYGRTRNVNGAVPRHREIRHLQSPITISLRHIMVDARYEDFLTGKPRFSGETHADLKLKSRMLLKPSSP
jgi:hypothetical protein